MTEKHGGIWIEDETAPVVFERFDEHSEALAIVRHLASGLYRAQCFERASDPQWRLPVWSERDSGALFDLLAEASSHAERLLQEDPT